jgi:hypothetical protein
MSFKSVKVIRNGGENSGEVMACQLAMNSGK